jgi:hypothetical protein
VDVRCGRARKKISLNQKFIIMFLNPFIALLHNTKQDSYHPIVFNERPLPGVSREKSDLEEIAGRYKSYGHHTTGFASRELALVDIRDNLVERVRANSAGEVKFFLAPDQLIPWDGEDIPAIRSVFLREHLQTEMPPA